MRCTTIEEAQGHRPGLFCAALVCVMVQQCNTGVYVSIAVHPQVWRMLWSTTAAVYTNTADAVELLQNVNLSACIYVCIAVFCVFFASIAL